MLNGRPIHTAAAWRSDRRPELKALFEHHMYGQAPAPVALPQARVVKEDGTWFGGAAIRREIDVPLAAAGGPVLRLLCIAPRSDDEAPCLVGPNFSGNADAEREDPDQRNVWAFRRAVDRGIATATFHAADVDPDRNDFTDGVHPSYPAFGGPHRGPHTWGTIAAWAWGISRAADALRALGGVHPGRIGAVGHSRMGKAALLAAAFDEELAFAIPSESGCGGAAPSRTTVGETVRKINDAFPHWFALAFREYNDHPEQLPFDQHALIALVAPRPILVCNAVEDAWANPAGQFAMLKGASPVWELLGEQGLAADRLPDPGRSTGGAVRYFLRPGEHAMSSADWEAYLDFVTETG